MSEVLARIKIREIHGIRRFLYPLFDTLPLPGGLDLASLSLTSPDGQAVPFQITPEDEGRHQRYTLDFAISLPPYAEQELLLTRQGSHTPVPDPLRLTLPLAGNAVESAQERLQLSIGRDGWLRQVVYDAVEHLRTTSAILRNGESVLRQQHPEQKGGGLLGAWVEVSGEYDDDTAAQTRSDITPCKSWVNVQHVVSWPKAGDEIVFLLPLVVASPTLTCDFGVGGGIYGKLQAGAVEKIVWRSEFDREEVRWSITMGERTDYVGTVKTRAEYLAQRWFHLIDSNKALAVAIIAVPDECREMTVTLSITGDVQIAFRLGENTEICEYAIFGVCYHFLNDVPAIAAATNPQSILLPPLVEVLPPLVEVLPA